MESQMIDYDTLQSDESLINAYLVKSSSRTYKEYNELSWDSASFFAKIILASQNNVALDAATIQTEINLFNENNLTNVSLNYLLGKFWLRSIAGQIKISGAILHLLTDNNGFKLPKEIDNKELLDNFGFMEFLAEKYRYEDSRSCEIPLQRFNSIYTQFKDFYPKAPPLESLLQDFKITKKNDKYIFNLWQTVGKVNQTSLSAQILYSLLQSRDFHNDTEIIKEWLKATQFIFKPEVYQNLPEWEKTRYLIAAKNILSTEQDLEDGFEDEKIFLNEDLAHYSFLSAKDIVLKTGVSNYSIKYNELFIKWLKFYSKRKWKISFLDFNIREDYVKLLQSLLINSIQEPDAFDVTELFENRPYLLNQTIFYLNRVNPTRLLAYIDNDKYGLIFFCSFLFLCEDQFYKQKPNEHIPFAIIEKYAQTFVQKNLIPKKNFKHAALFLMLLVKGIYDSRWSELYKIVYEKIIIEIPFQSPSSIFFKTALDVYNNYQQPIWEERVRQIKICAFHYLFFFLNRTEAQEKEECFSLINTLYNDSVFQNDSFSYWSEWNEIDKLDWSTFFNWLFKHNKLSSFCQEIKNHLNYDPNEQNFDKQMSSPKKLRFHLKILCSVYCEWRKHEDNDKINLLESNIVQILNSCFVNKPEKQKFAIFEAVHESNFGADFNNELFPLVISTIKLFDKSNRKKILVALSMGDDPRLQIKAYNHLPNTEDKDYIKDSINLTEDIDYHFNTFDDFTSFLRDLYNSHLNDDFADMLLKKLDNQVRQRVKDQVAAPFVLDTEILKIYNLYWKKDVENLIQYKCLYEDYSGRYKESLIDLKNEQYYLISLLKIEQKAYNEAWLYINRIKEGNSTKLKYKAARLYLKFHTLQGKEVLAPLLQEIQKIEKTETRQPQDWYYLYLTKVALYSSMDKEEDLLNLYHSLGSNQSELQLVKPIVEYFISRQNWQMAIQTFNTIKVSNEEKEEYNSLKSKISWADEIPILKNSYLQILGLPNDYRFKVLPPSISKHSNNPGLFVVYDLCTALNILLKKIKAVSASSSHMSEDYKTDLLQSILNGRLSMLGYKFEDQNRSGQSAGKGKQAGELDLSMDLGCSTVVLEAINCNGWNADLKKHIEKVFNYDPSRHILINLMYYEGKNDEFFSKWDVIKKYVTDNTKVNYPLNYGIIDQQEISNITQNNSIKVLKCVHENNLEFYHIFANFSYYT
ncbi:hypothetical protein FSU_3258 [Fibrobacter succinogenes subsp. succinogenes S85]|uniref:Uncharacterized protein n=2 Tax=Fibrobacter succinogenes (strain ATCC 19169 / S85) TaxID=59374 RepID=D9S923_FIBSS|nr:hypothetical protein FSU_3258 [Fibrobacter succinogenes subsp. succinogenes S85]